MPNERLMPRRGWVLSLKEMIDCNYASVRMQNPKLRTRIREAKYQGAECFLMRRALVYPFTWQSVVEIQQR